MTPSPGTPQPKDEGPTEESAGFRDDVARLRDHYDALCREHGDSPRSAQLRDRATQERLLEILTQVGDLRRAKILDFGCGTGALLDFLRGTSFVGEYVGLDLSPSAVATAQQKHPQCRFKVRDVLTQDLDESFDYILISGIFNNRVSDNWSMFTAILKRLFPHVRQALAFNALSTYVDYCEPGLSYLSPTDVFRFCKEELSPLVTLRHDYLMRDGVVPYDFTVYVYRSDVPARKELRP